MKKSTFGIAAMLALTEMESIASHRGDDMWGVVILRVVYLENQDMVDHR